MTPQEAIKAMKFYKGKLYNGIFNQYISAFDVAISAIEKQIPQEPVRESLADRACPRCSGYIPFDALNDNIADAPIFCKECGQSLDWRTDNA